MTQSLNDFLIRILNAHSPSGSEENVISLFVDFITPYISEIRIDALGNCIALKKGTGNRKIMLMAHADEIGLMINYIDDRGFLYFKCIGGLDCNLLPSRQVSILGENGTVTGVIGKKPIHLMGQDNLNKSLQPEDLWIDIGVKDKAEAESLVNIGDVVTLLSNTNILANDYIISKSTDDRVGIAILAGVAQNIKQLSLGVDVFLVASVQEEIGARGAQVATNAILPDEGIAIDVTHATDYPTMSPIKDGDISLGGGVVIPFGPNMNKCINISLMDTAKTNGIPFQKEAIAGPTPTDARMIQIAGAGIRTGLLSIPCRYMHTPNEIISVHDVDSAVSLLTEYLKNASAT